MLRTRCPGAAGTTAAGNASEGVPITTDDGDHVCRVGVRLCLQAVSPVVCQYSPDGQRRWGHMTVMIVSLRARDVEEAGVRSR